MNAVYAETFGRALPARSTIEVARLPRDVLVEIECIAVAGAGVRAGDDRAGKGGRLLHIHIAAAASDEMEELLEARLVAGKGIEGDRYFLGTGTYSLQEPDIPLGEVTLIEIEALEAPGQERSAAAEASPHRRWRRSTTAAISPPVAFRSAILLGQALSRRRNSPARRPPGFPCKYLEELLGGRCLALLYEIAPG